MKGRIYVYRKWKHIKWWNLEEEEGEEEKEVVEIEEDDEEIESEIEQEEENEEKGVVEIDDKEEEDEADGDGAIPVLKNNCQKHRWRNRCRGPPTTFEFIIFSHFEVKLKKNQEEEKKRIFFNFFLVY